MKHIALRRTWNPFSRYTIIGLTALTAITLFMLTGTIAAICVGVLIGNAVLEYHKRFTQALPLDIEIISVGVAYVAATSNIAWSFILAVLGPIVAHALLDYFGDATIVKIASLAATAIAASILGSTPWALFSAVLIGFAFQWIGFVVVLGRDPVSNSIARLTTILFSAYLVFVLLPLA